MPERFTRKIYNAGCFAATREPSVNVRHSSSCPSLRFFTRSGARHLSVVPRAFPFAPSFRSLFFFMQTKSRAEPAREYRTGSRLLRWNRRPKSFLRKTEHKKMKPYNVAGLVLVGLTGNALLGQLRRLALNEVAAQSPARKRRRRPQNMPPRPQGGSISRVTTGRSASLLERRQRPMSSVNFESSKTESDIMNPVSPVLPIWGPLERSPQNLQQQDLHNEYHTIFSAGGNRNAASHLWSSFVLDRAAQFSAERFGNQAKAEQAFIELFQGFCAVSGSPVQSHDFNRYGLELDFVSRPHDSLIKEGKELLELHEYERQRTIGNTGAVLRPAGAHSDAEIQEADLDRRLQEESRRC